MMKRFLRVAMLLCVGAVLLGALSLHARGAQASTTSGKGSQNLLNSTACGKWSVVPSPNGSSSPNGLNGVAALSATDAWAVGSSGSQKSGAQTLIEHWNGTTWSAVTSANPGSIYDTLYSITAISTNNVWAVGYYVNTPGITQTLVEHWNGTSWSAVTSPNPGSQNNELFSVSADSAHDIWAVGFSTTNTNDHTLIEHWNGTSWSVVKSLNPGPSNDHLASVTAISANDAWAVGDGSTFSKTLVEHWNGTSWSVVTSPSPGSGNALTSVTAVSATNVWAAGYTNNASASQSLVEHWNGTSWSVVTSANIGSSPSFWAMTAISATDIWAVGSYGTSTEFAVTLTEHWNGQQWSIVKSPSPGSFNTQLVGVAAVSATDVWAVGHADSNTLIEHYHC